MRPSMLRRLWESSPQRAYASVRALLRKKRPMLQWVTVPAGPLTGVHLRLDLARHPAWREMAAGVFDSFIYEAIEKKGHRPSTAWDVGAHFGYHSLGLASLVGANGRVYAFEPNSFNAARFREHLDRNPQLSARIVLKEWALAAEDGEAPFSMSSAVDDGQSTGSHLCAGSVPLGSDHYKTFRPTRVLTRQIDTLLSLGEIRPADLVKIDVEGAELMVLEGGTQFFRTARPYVFMEVHNIRMMFHCMQFLTRLGYSLNILDEDNASTSRCFLMAVP